MSKKVKRTISVIIAAIMLLSTMSVLAFADLPTYPEAASKYVAVPHEHVATFEADGITPVVVPDPSTYAQPTCLKEGSQEYYAKCKICGKEIPGTRYKVALPSLDSHHQAGPVAIENIKQPTCKDTGSYYEVVRCVLCNKILRKTPVTVQVATNAHVPDLPVKENIVPATCSTEGSYWSVTRCKVCDTELARVLKVIPKNKDIHANLSGSIKKDEKRTCADGEVVCKDCGAVIQAQIPHTWDAGTVGPKATTDTQGVITYKCLIKGCNAEFKVFTPKLSGLPKKAGDVDADGDVTAADARYILRYAVGLGNYDKVISAEIVKFADMDGNAKVEPADARMALRAAVGLPN